MTTPTTNKTTVPPVLHGQHNP
uniref:Uncharacterized protein n=1 Tax=Anguilla anguilla TaxID=7936 RepID=A0A0E9QXS4_ANGAN